MNGVMYTWSAADEAQLRSSRTDAVAAELRQLGQDMCCQLRDQQTAAGPGGVSDSFRSNAPTFGFSFAAPSPSASAATVALVSAGPATSTPFFRHYGSPEPSLYREALQRQSATAGCWAQAPAPPPPPPTPKTPSTPSGSLRWSQHGRTASEPPSRQRSPKSQSSFRRSQNVHFVKSQSSRESGRHSSRSSKMINPSGKIKFSEDKDTRTRKKPPCRDASTTAVAMEDVGVGTPQPAPVPTEDVGIGSGTVLPGDAEIHTHDFDDDATVQQPISESLVAESEDTRGVLMSDEIQDHLRLTPERMVADILRVQNTLSECSKRLQSMTIAERTPLPSERVQDKLEPETKKVQAELEASTRDLQKASLAFAKSYSTLTNQEVLDIHDLSENEIHTPLVSESVTLVEERILGTDTNLLPTIEEAQHNDMRAKEIEISPRVPDNNCATSMDESFLLSKHDYIQEDVDSIGFLERLQGAKKEVLSKLLTSNASFHLTKTENCNSNLSKVSGDVFKKSDISLFHEVTIDNHKVPHNLYSNPTSLEPENRLSEENAILDHLRYTKLDTKPVSREYSSSENLSYYCLSSDITQHIEWPKPEMGDRHVWKENTVTTSSATDVTSVPHHPLINVRSAQLNISACGFNPKRTERHSDDRFQETIAKEPEQIYDEQYLTVFRQPSLKKKQGDNKSANSVNIAQQAEKQSPEVQLFQQSSKDGESHQVQQSSLQTVRPQSEGRGSSSLPCTKPKMTHTGMVQSTPNTPVSNRPHLQNCFTSGSPSRPPTPLARYKKANKLTQSRKGSSNPHSRSQSPMPSQCKRNSADMKHFKTINFKKKPLSGKQASISNMSPTTGKKWSRWSKRNSMHYRPLKQFNNKMRKHLRNKMSSSNEFELPNDFYSDSDSNTDPKTTTSSMRNSRLSDLECILHPRIISDVTMKTPKAASEKVTNKRVSVPQRTFGQKSGKMPIVHKEDVIQPGSVGNRKMQNTCSSAEQHSRKVSGEKRFDWLWADNDRQATKILQSSNLNGRKQDNGVQSPCRIKNDLNFQNPCSKIEGRSFCHDEQRDFRSVQGGEHCIHKPPVNKFRNNQCFPNQRENNFSKITEARTENSRPPRQCEQSFDRTSEFGMPNCYSCARGRNQNARRFDVSGERMWGSRCERFVNHPFRKTNARNCFNTPDEENHHINSLETEKEGPSDRMFKYDQQSLNCNSSDDGYTRILKRESARDSNRNTQNPSLGMCQSNRIIKSSFSFQCRKTLNMPGTSPKREFCSNSPPMCNAENIKNTKVITKPPVTAKQQKKKAKSKAERVDTDQTICKVENKINRKKPSFTRNPNQNPPSTYCKPQTQRGVETTKGWGEMTPTSNFQVRESTRIDYINRPIVNMCLEQNVENKSVNHEKDSTLKNDALSPSTKTYVDEAVKVQPRSIPEAQTDIWCFQQTAAAAVMQQLSKSSKIVGILTIPETEPAENVDQPSKKDKTQHSEIKTGHLKIEREFSIIETQQKIESETQRPPTPLSDKKVTDVSLGVKSTEKSIDKPLTLSDKNSEKSEATKESILITPPSIHDKKRPSLSNITTDTSLSNNEEYGKSQAENLKGPMTVSQILAFQNIDVKQPLNSVMRCLKISLEAEGTNIKSVPLHSLGGTSNLSGSNIKKECPLKHTSYPVNKPTDTCEQSEKTEHKQIEVAKDITETPAPRPSLCEIQRTVGLKKETTKNIKSTKHLPNINVQRTKHLHVASSPKYHASKSLRNTKKIHNNNVLKKKHRIVTKKKPSNSKWREQKSSKLSNDSRKPFEPKKVILNKKKIGIRKKESSHNLEGNPPCNNDVSNLIPNSDVFTCKHCLNNVCSIHKRILSCINVLRNKATSEKGQFSFVTNKMVNSNGGNSMARESQEENNTHQPYLQRDMSKLATLVDAYTQYVNYSDEQIKNISNNNQHAQIKKDEDEEQSKVAEDEQQSKLEKQTPTMEKAIYSPPKELINVQMTNDSYIPNTDEASNTKKIRNTNFPTCKELQGAQNHHKHSKVSGKIIPRYTIHPRKPPMSSSSSSSSGDISSKDVGHIEKRIYKPVKRGSHKSFKCRKCGKVHSKHRNPYKGHINNDRHNSLPKASQAEVVLRVHSLEFKEQADPNTATVDTKNVTISENGMQNEQEKRTTNKVHRSPSSGVREAETICEHANKMENRNKKEREKSHKDDKSKQHHREYRSISQNRSQSDTSLVKRRQYSHTLKRTFSTKNLTSSLHPPSQQLDSSRKRRIPESSKTPDREKRNRSTENKSEYRSQWNKKMPQKCDTMRTDHQRHSHSNRKYSEDREMKHATESSMPCDHRKRQHRSTGRRDSSGLRPSSPFSSTTSAQSASLKPLLHKMCSAIKAPLHCLWSRERGQHEVTLRHPPPECDKSKMTIRMRPQNTGLQKNQANHKKQPNAAKDSLNRSKE